MLKSLFDANVEIVVWCYCWNLCLMLMLKSLFDANVEIFVWC